MERVRRGVVLLLGAAAAYALAILLANQWRVNGATDSMVIVLAFSGLVSAVFGFILLILGIWHGSGRKVDR